MDFIYFLTLFVLIVSYLIHAEWYLRRLKKHFPEQFASIGSPSVIGKRQSALPVLQFFLSGEFRRLPDKSVVGMGTRLAIHFIVVLVFFVTVFISVSF